MASRYSPEAASISASSAFVGEVSLIVAFVNEIPYCNLSFQRTNCSELIHKFSENNVLKRSYLILTYIIDGG